MADGEKVRLHDVAVACDTRRGRVTVSGQLSAAFDYPVMDLSLISVDGQLLAGTMIVDAPPEFQMTLHPRPAVTGMSLVLRVEVFEGEDIALLQEYPFTFEP